MGSAILLDFENVYWGIVRNYSDPPNLGKLIDGLKELVDEQQVLLFLAYADFDIPEFKGFQSEFQRRRVEPRHVFSNTSDQQRRKNSADIEMSLEALELVFTRDDIDYFVLVSGDRDFIPIIKRLLNRGKTVHVVAVKKSTSVDLRSFADKFTSIEDLLGISPAGIMPESEHKAFVITKLNVFESGRMPFVGLSHFTKNLAHGTHFNVYSTVADLISEGIIEQYKVENPNNPDRPTTACRLNRDHELVQQVLNNERENIEKHG